MAQQGQPQGDDSNELFKVALILLILLLIAIAVLASQQERINAFVGAVAWLHVMPFAYATRAMPFLQHIPWLSNWLFLPAENIEGFLAKGGYALMAVNESGIDERSQVLKISGHIAFLIYGPILLWVGLRGRDFRVDRKYRTRHTLESMIWAQSDVWMTSRMVRHINPLKEQELSAEKIARSVRDALAKAVPLPGKLLPRRQVFLAPDTWNRSLRPEEWLILKGLAYEGRTHKALTAEGVSPKAIDFEFRGQWEGIELESISEILAEQLRQPWKGPEGMRPAHKAIFAVMALFYAYDTDGGNKLLSDLGILADANRARKNTMDSALQAETGMMARIDRIIASDAGRKLTRAADRHAWLESAFPTFIYLARKDRGVLPAAAFLWLKAEDRLLWYILDNVGNEAVMIEAAGALAHSRAEAQIGKPIHRPAVYQAARAMREDYMDLMPDRIVHRREKIERSRNPGDQVNLIMKSILHDTGPDADEDGLDEDRKA